MGAMGGLQVSLFGRFKAHRENRRAIHLEGQKVQELFCYLLIYHQRAHSREKLASLLWENSSAAKSKQYLRQSLWQLQAVLRANNGSGEDLISVDSDWIRINPAAELWCDIHQFERVVERMRGVRGHQLDGDGAGRLKEAVAHYQGDLLEGWYRDWCLLERERFQNNYLSMLDKLVSYCEQQQNLEEGIAYGIQILRTDLARERTYRDLMRLHYRAGDRTGAMRRYERCREVLDHEVGVQPAARTKALYESIKAGRPLIAEMQTPGPEIPSGEAPTLPDLLNYLNSVQAALAAAQREFEGYIQAVERALDDGISSEHQ